MKEITECQKEVLHFINDYFAQNYRPPTIREVADNFNITVKAAQDRISALRKKNYLAPGDNSSRSLRVVVDLDSKNKNFADVISVPLLGSAIQDKPVLSSDNIEGRIAVPSSFLSKNAEYFALIVKGESMKNVGIMDGDTAIIQCVETALDGEIVAAVIDEVITLKRYFNEGSRIKLQSENEDFKPIYSQTVRIIGKLATIIRIY